jgi:hypothetical protein
VGARAPFDRGRLATAGELSKMQGLVVWISAPYGWCRGLDASLQGIPLSTSPLSLNTFEGVSRKWLEPWPCMGPLSDVPYSVYSRAVVEPPLRAGFRTLVAHSGLEARGSFAWKCPSVGLPSRPLGCIFLGGKQKWRGSGRRGRRLPSERLTHALICGFRGSG